MFSLSKFNAYLITNFIKYSTKSKAEIMKNLNYENKALFGPVMRDKKRKKSSVIDSEKSGTKADDSENENDKINRTNLEKDYISERYWLLEYKHERTTKSENEPFQNHNKVISSRNEKQVKFESLSESLNYIRHKKPKLKQNKFSDSTVVKESISPSEASSLGTRAADNSSISTTSSSPSTEESPKNEIPFSTNELRNILKFPLILNEGNYPIANNLISTDHPHSIDALASMKLPSVSKILQATMSEYSRKALINWKLTKIQELGEDGFEKMKLELLNQGKLFHKALQEYLVSYETPVIDSSIDGVWNSVIVALESLKPKTKLIEAPVQHPYLKYCGVVDYVSHVRSNLSVIEWKKSNRIKNRIDLTYDAPLQLCAYLGALSADEKYKIEANCGYVVIAYTDGQPAKIHYLDKIALQNNWNLWLRRVQEYWIRYKDGTLPEPI